MDADDYDCDVVDSDACQVFQQNRVRGLLRSNHKERQSNSAPTGENGHRRHCHCNHIFIVIIKSVCKGFSIILLCVYYEIFPNFEMKILLFFEFLTGFTFYF